MNNPGASPEEFPRLNFSLIFYVPINDHTITAMPSCKFNYVSGVQDVCWKDVIYSFDVNPLSAADQQQTWNVKHKLKEMPPSKNCLNDNGVLISEGTISIIVKKGRTCTDDIPCPGDQHCCIDSGTTTGLCRAGNEKCPPPKCGSNTAPRNSCFPMMNDEKAVDECKDAKGVFSTLAYKPTDGGLFDFDSRSSQAYRTYCPEEAPCCMELDKNSQDVRCGDDNEGVCMEKSCPGKEVSTDVSTECKDKKIGKDNCCKA